MFFLFGNVSFVLCLPVWSLNILFVFALEPSPRKAQTTPKTSPRRSKTPAGSFKIPPRPPQKTNHSFWMFCDIDSIKTRPRSSGPRYLKTLPRCLPPQLLNNCLLFSPCLAILTHQIFPRYSQDHPRHRKMSHKSWQMLDTRKFCCKCPASESKPNPTYLPRVIISRILFPNPSKTESKNVSVLPSKRNCIRPFLPKVELNRF